MTQAPHGDDGARSGAAADPPVPLLADTASTAFDGSRVRYCGVARCR